MQHSIFQGGADHCMPKTPRLILILGGARSGKSSYAERLAMDLAPDGNVLYVATAQVWDEDREMRDRIKQHQAQRPTSWHTVEIATQLADGLDQYLHATACAGDPPHLALPSVDTPLPPSTTLQPAQVLPPAVVLVDCLTLLTANILTSSASASDGNDAGTNQDATKEQMVYDQIEALITWYEQHDSHLILVTNEVGMGIVPAYPLGRWYRDVLGRVNARVAARADAVLLMVAGLPQDLRERAEAWEAQWRTMRSS